MFLPYTGYIGEASAKSFYAVEPDPLSITNLIIHAGIRTGN